MKVDFDKMVQMVERNWELMKGQGRFRNLNLREQEQLKTMILNSVLAVFSFQSSISGPNTEWIRDEFREIKGLLAGGGPTRRNSSEAQRDVSGEAEVAGLVEHFLSGQGKVQTNINSVSVSGGETAGVESAVERLKEIGGFEDGEGS